jgi:hypothetical protein
MIRTALSAALLVAGLAAAAEAQSAPPISAPKNAARRAVGAANARTAAQQNVDGPSQRPAAAPSGTAQAPTPRKPAAAQPAAAQPAPAPSPAGAQAASAQGTPAPGPAAPTLAVADTARGTRSTTVAERGGRDEVTFRREVYGYESGGRRDPFVSLLASGELRPILSDLRLVAVAYDPTGRNSVAIMRDQSTKDQYRVKVGQSLGRMRVAQIQPKSVTFTIEEFGYSRREELALGDSSTVRRQ